MAGFPYLGYYKPLVFCVTALVGLFSLIILAGVPFARDIRSYNHTESDLWAKPVSNARALGMYCKKCAVEHGGKFPQSLDALVPSYIKDRSLLASPLNPSDPNGYIYITGLEYRARDHTLLLEDKFAPLKHAHLVVYTDGGYRLDTHPQIAP